MTTTTTIPAARTASQHDYPVAPRRRPSPPGQPPTRRVALGVLCAVLLGGCEDHTAGVAAATVEGPSAAAAPPLPGPTAVPSARSSLAIDPATSSVGFTGAKITRSHDGTFSRFEGSIELDRADLVASSVRVSIDVASLAIEPADLGRHLLTADFFDVATHPTATFVSTSVTAGATGTIDGAPATHTIAGDLTLHGRTQRITFPAIVEVTDAGVRARSEFTIDRRDFGIEYPGMPDDLIHDEVVIRFDVRTRAT